MTTKPTIARLSMDTVALVDALRSVAVGVTLTKQELSAVIGQGIDARRSVLQTAIKMLWDEGVFFHVVRGLGVRRVSDNEAIATPQQAVHRVRRAARKATHRARRIDIHKLTPEERAQLAGNTALLALVSEVATPSSVKRLVAAANPDGATMAMERTWRALRGQAE